METQTAVTGFKTICFMLLCFPLELECRNKEQVENRLKILEQKFGFHAYEYTLLQQDIHKLQDRVSNIENVTVETEGDLEKIEYDEREVKQMDTTEVNQKLTELDDVTSSLLNAFKNEKQERIRIETELETLKETHRSNKVDIETFVKFHKQEMVDMQYKIDTLKLIKKSIEVSLITEHLQPTEDKIFQIFEKLENIDNLQHSFVKEDVFKQQTEAMGVNFSVMDIVLTEKYDRLAMSMEHKYQSVVTKVTGIFESQQQQVSFSARLSNSIATLDPWETVVFDSVITNIGNAYSGGTGVFTAPYDGIYVFYTHILAADRPLEISLNKNGINMMWLYVDGSSRGGDSNLAVLQLGKGDTVKVVKHGPWGTKPFYVHRVWSTFSGYMLYPI